MHWPPDGAGIVLLGVNARVSFLTSMVGSCGSGVRGGVDSPPTLSVSDEDNRLAVHAVQNVVRGNLGG